MDVESVRLLSGTPQVRYRSLGRVRVGLDDGDANRAATQAEAETRLRRHAHRLGANAVANVRFVLGSPEDARRKLPAGSMELVAPRIEPFTPWRALRAEGEAVVLGRTPPPIRTRATPRAGTPTP